MPIYFNLEELRKKHDCKIYLETGLWDSTNSTVSIRKAIKSNFEKVFSIEILDKWIKIGNEVFQEEIKNGRVEIIKLDSVNLSLLLNREEFNSKTLFYLDAHVDNHEITNFKFKCPIFNEINAIKNLNRKDHIILVDDLRIFKTNNPWNENSYGDIDFITEIKKSILEINPNYIFDILDDTLYCYV